MKKMISILALAISLSALAPLGHAQWSTNPSVNTPVCTAPRRQDGPSCISDGAGGAIFAWLDLRSDSDSAYVYVQKINAAGIPQWESNGIRTANTYLPSSGFCDFCSNFGELVSDGAGGAIIAFVKGRLDTTGIIAGDAYAQRVDASGSIRWQGGGVLLSGGENGQIPTRIMSDGAGGAIVAIRDARYATYPDRVEMVSVQRINSAGTVLWGAQGIPIVRSQDSTNCLVGKPDLVNDGAGGAIVVWGDCRNHNSNNQNKDIFAQRVNSSGVPLWASNGVPVCTAPGYQEFSRVVSDSAGGAIVSWQDSSRNVMAQRINSAGVSQWALNGIVVSRTSIGGAFEKTITSDGTGGAIIAWTDIRAGTYLIYAQRLNQSGALQWAAGGVPICLNPWQAVKNIISDGAGGAIITWVGYYYPPLDIYAQRVNPAGVVQWNTNGVVITNAPDIQGQPFLTSAGTGAAILVWTDLRAGGALNSHIYAQRVNANGTLGGPTSVEQDNTPTEFLLEQNYPNPFNPTTAIQFSVGTYGHTSLRVFNLLGQEVATLVNEQKQPGSYSVQFGKNLSSGVYFYRLTSGGRSLTKKLLLTK